jgi:hypothetical protein
VKRYLRCAAIVLIAAALAVIGWKTAAKAHDFWVLAGDETTSRGWSQPVWVALDDLNPRQLSSPYEGDGLSWFKVVTHLHSNNSEDADSLLTLDSLRTLFCGSLGADVLFITDHNRVTNTDLLPGNGSCTLGFGVELTYGHGHILALAASRQDLSAALVEQLAAANSAVASALEAIAHLDEMSSLAAVMPSTQQFLSRVEEAGGLSILAHPFEGSALVWTPAKLGEVTGLHGVEIANAGWGLIATEAWDSLLSHDHHIHGFAGEDYHGALPFVYSPGRFSNYVLAPSSAPASILASLKQGRFYASTGAQLRSLAVDGNTIRIELPTEAMVRFIGEGGRTLQESFGDSASYEIAGTEKYIRVEWSHDAPLTERLKVVKRLFSELLQANL